MKALDDYFQAVAFSIGFKPDDLLPIDREIVEFQSLNFTKGMTQKQKQFYINKKIVVMMEKQNNIIREVEKQIKKRELSYKFTNDHNSKLHNPTVIKLLAEHEKIIEKNAKYLQTLYRKQKIDNEKSDKRHNSSNMRKTQKSIRSNQSSVSNRSNKSNQSNQSLSSNKSSDKSRLMMVRQRDKEKQQIKKEFYKQKQLQNSKKLLKASEENLKKSQRVKTRSQINKQIVNENKRDLQFMKNTEIKEHLEQLKFKIQKTQMIRTKNIQRKIQKDQHSSYNSVKRTLIGEQNRISQVERQREKSKTASVRIQNREVIRSQARNYNRLTELLKTQNTRKNREMKQQEERQFLQALRQNEAKRLQTAQLNRYYLRDINKQKHFQNDIKYGLIRKNAESRDYKRYQQSQDVSRRLSSKFNQLQEIDDIKQRLVKQRKKIARQMNFERNTLELRSFHPKINSYFDI